VQNCPNWETLRDLYLFLPLLLLFLLPPHLSLVIQSCISGVMQNRCSLDLLFSVRQFRKLISSLTSHT